jgi:transposase InsO family protein
VPMSTVRMRREVELYVGWYNEERPHRGLGGHVPAEILRGLRRARDRPSWEVRQAHPLARRTRRLKGRLVLVADRVGARAHLPVVRPDRAA